MYKKLMLVLFMCFILSGCYDRKEIDDYAYVIAIGVDKAEGGKYKFTASVANPNVIGEAKEKAEGALSNITVEATDFFSATEIINYNLSKKINLSHTNLIIFSKSIAQKGLKTFTDSFVRELKIRPATLVAISEDATSYLENLKPILEINPEKYFKEIFDEDNANFLESATLSEFFYATNADERNIVLPVVNVVDDKNEKKDDAEDKTYNENDVELTKLPIKSGNKSMITGIAFFADDKLISTGTYAEDVFHSFISKKTGKISYTVNVSEKNDNLVVSMTEFKRPKIKVKCEKIPKISVELFVDCEVVYLPEGISKSKDSEKISKIVQDDLNKNIKLYLEKTSKTLKCDIENFSKYAKRNFLTYKDWQAYNWKEKYKNADFFVDAEVNVVKFGILEND
ncbi:MAG: Ger(x)C family spore germination protein [Ruminococcaceae bacterium]|nr:Ger(x)C family spore germination protein [Oscillospiraceae bacterium]